MSWDLNSNLASTFQLSMISTFKTLDYTGTDLRVGLVGLGPGPPHFGGPTLSVLGLVGFI